MVCFRCRAWMWSFHLKVETAVDITRNAMGTRRRTQYRPSLQIPLDLVIIALSDCVSFTHVGLWNMCLSGFRGTSIPVKQCLRELSPERGFKMTLEFYDTFRGVGPIKYFCSVVYKTSKFINMYSGCFECKVDLVKFLHNLQIHKYVFRLF